MQSAASLHATTFTRPLSVHAAIPGLRYKQPKAKFACQAANRPMWLTGANPPSYLDGSLPGDYGFDPLGLGANPERLEWFVEGERTNGRWAMMAVSGILFTELLGVEDKFWMAGTKDYGVSINALVAVEAVIMGFLEMKRLQGFKEKKSAGFLNWFPFDPLNMKSAEMAVKEVKNGRLAMVAIFGFFFQALVVRKGPIACLGSHLADPFNNNILTNILNISDNITNN